MIFFVNFMDFMVRMFNFGQGEELKKAIGAAAYIECSSKTQQVWFISFLIFNSMNTFKPVSQRLKGVFKFRKHN